jgi:hypothetical protein
LHRADQLCQRVKGSHIILFWAHSDEWSHFPAVLISWYYTCGVDLVYSISTPFLPCFSDKKDGKATWFASQLLLYSSQSFIRLFTKLSSCSHKGTTFFPGSSNCRFVYCCIWTILFIYFIIYIYIYINIFINFIIWITNINSSSAGWTDISHIYCLNIYR